LSKKDFQGLTNIRRAGCRRLLDARALLTCEEPDEHAQCAKYLASYAVECKLKAMAMETFRCFTLAELAEKLQLDESDVFAHNLEKLAKHMRSMYNRLKEMYWFSLNWAQAQFG
jgi:hypothetical protein